MKLFEKNKAVSDLSELEQAIILFRFQQKYVSELNSDDCYIIAELLEELKELREKVPTEEVLIVKYELTDEMKKDRLNCGEDADCNECSCQIGTDDCIYNHITTVADCIKKMNNNQLAIYLHSWQTENMSVEEIKDLLNEEYRAPTEKQQERVEERPIVALR